MRHPVHCLALGFGTGLSPYAPGTFGSAAGLVIYLMLPVMEPVAYAIFVLATFIVGIKVCAFTAQALGTHDHPGIVWDELVGIWVSLFALPPEWYWLIIAFLIFRFFDIVKPWPIRVIDRRVYGGLGIMLDDVLAGLFTLASVHLLYAVFAR